MIKIKVIITVITKIKVIIITKIKVIITKIKVIITKIKVIITKIMNYLNHLNYHQLVKYQHVLLELYFTVMDYLIIYLEIILKMDNFITISQVKFKIKMVRYFKKLKEIIIVHFTRVHFAIIITNL